MHGDLDLVGTGHDGPGAQRHAAGVEPGPAVQPHDAIDRRPDDGPVERAALDHVSAAASAFLGGLEQQRDWMGQAAFAPERGEHARGTDEDGGVAVMTARVHAAGRGARPCRARGFGDGQRIHVGAQGGRAVAGCGKVRQHPGSARQPTAVLDAGGGEFALHDLARASFLERRLRVGVQVAAQRDERGKLLMDQRAQPFGRGHAVKPSGGRGHGVTRASAPGLRTAAS